jgi:N-glycosidase YbiA
MSVTYCRGDLFLSRAQALAHGVNCAGVMGAGIAVEFKSRFPAMFKEYKNRCARGDLRPGGVYLENTTVPWVLNLATQADVGSATLESVESTFRWIAKNFAHERICSIALPRIAAGLGLLDWDDVKVLIRDILDSLPIPIYVYEHFTEGVAADETRVAVQFYRQTEPLFGCFSNFYPSEILIDSTAWPTVEHYFQAMKFPRNPEVREMIRAAEKPMDTKKIANKTYGYLYEREWWYGIRDGVMLDGVRAKFTQHGDLRAILLGTGGATLMEHTTNDTYWGDAGDGTGKNMLGKTLMIVRDECRRAGSLLQE